VTAGMHVVPVAAAAAERDAESVAVRTWEHEQRYCVAIDYDYNDWRIAVVNVAETKHTRQCCGA